MNPNRVPGFLTTHSAVAFVLGLCSACLIDLGSGALVVVRGARLDAGLLVSAGAIATLLLQRIALRGWKRHVNAQTGETLPDARRGSPAMAAPALPTDAGRRAGTVSRSAVTR